MTYNAPSSDAIEFDIEDSYTAPSSDSLEFDIGTGEIKTISFDTTSDSTLTNNATGIFALSSTISSDSKLLNELQGGAVSTPNRLGSNRVGNSQLGLVANVRTINLSTTSNTSLSHNLVGILSIAGSFASTSTLSHNINGTFTLELKPNSDRIGSRQLGQTRVGVTSEGFASATNLFHDINGTFTLSKASTSTSNLSLDLTRVFVINLNSTGVSAYDLTQQRIREVDLTASSVSTYNLILSEDSYVEQYGREQGQAQLDTIARGNADRDTIVQGNAELDIIVVGNADVD